MRTALLGIALCCASLAGLAPPQALATNPPSLERAPVAPAPEKSSSAGPDTSPGKDASARKDVSARQDSAGQQRPGSDRPQRAMPAPAGQRELVAQPLDLSAPPISHVMTPEQVQALIGEQDSEPEDVTVEESRYQTPVPRGQVQALTWALVHPLQAWRIFTPVTDQ